MSWLDGFEHFVCADEPLAPRCWLRIGGPAEYFAQPTTYSELEQLVRRCRDHDLPLRLLGGGSNILVRDAGVKGVTIRLDAPEFGQISVEDDVVVAAGGADLFHVISVAVREGLAGLEQLVGIPGTLGGALHGNAGNLRHRCRCVGSKRHRFDSWRRSAGAES